MRPLGAGGMGEVYEAEHELLGVRRALKVLTRRYQDRDDLAERLKVEARALAGLSHPGIVQVHDLGISTDGRLYLAMELLFGETLRDVLAREGALTPRRALGIVERLLDALGAAHRRGLVHRDVKPENVFLVGADVVKLLDFGVTKVLRGDAAVTTLTDEGATVGTPRYMSPEQAEGRPVDPRSDLFAVGVVAWELLSGQPPHAELEPIAAAVRTILHGIPRLNTGVLPPPVVELVAKATAVRPDDRFADAETFRAAVARAAEACPTDPDQRALSVDERFGDTEVDPAPRGARTESVRPVDVVRGPHDVTTPTAAPRTKRAATPPGSTRASAETRREGSSARAWMAAGAVVVVAGVATYGVMRARAEPKADATARAPVSADPPRDSTSPPAQPAAPRPSAGPAPSASAQVSARAPSKGGAPAAPAAKGSTWLPPSGL